MQLNDALIESYRVYGWGYVLNHPVAEKKRRILRDEDLLTGLVRSFAMVAATNIIAGVFWLR